MQLYYDTHVTLFRVSSDVFCSFDIDVNSTLKSFLHIHSASKFEIKYETKHTTFSQKYTLRQH